jgi:magnesium-transporting ATPase (P-type)
MIPFNSETKKMTVVIEHDKGVRVFTKGASECIIDDCAFLLDPNVKTQLSNVGGNGSPRTAPVINLDLNLREKLKKALIEMAEKSFRTIALGYKDITMEEYKAAIGELEREESEKGNSPVTARDDSPSKSMQVKY